MTNLMDTLTLVAQKYQMPDEAQALDKIFFDDDPAVIEVISQTLPDVYASPDFKPQELSSGQYSPERDNRQSGRGVAESESCFEPSCRNILVKQIIDAMDSTNQNFDIPGFLDAYACRLLYHNQEFIDVKI